MTLAPDTAALLKRIAVLVADDYGFHEKALALVQTLDQQGLLDWHSPVEPGLPLLHWAIRQPKVSSSFFAWALRRSPDMLDQRSEAGQTLFEAIWDQYVEAANRVSPSQKSSSWTSASSFENVLASAIERAPLHHFGTTPEARESFQRKVVALGRESLSAAFQKACPLTVSDRQRQALLANLSASTWAAVRPSVGGLDEWVEVAPGVQRQFWRWGLDRSVGDRVQGDPGFVQLPLAVREEIQAWHRLRTMTSRAKGRSAPGKAQLWEGVEALPQGVASLSDTGCPVTWLLVQRNPAMLKDLLGRSDTRATFYAQDRAGHGCAFYLAHLLADPMLRKGLKLYDAEPFINAFGSVIDGRGLIAQWFADPARPGYLTKSQVMPKCTALDTAGLDGYAGGSGASQEETRWLYPLSRPQVWTMPSSDATTMVQRWLTSTKNLSARINGILPLWMSKEGRVSIEQSALGPYMPILASVSLVQYLLTAQKNLTSGNGHVALLAPYRRLWDRLASTPWHLEGLDMTPVTNHLMEMAAEASSVHPVAATMMQALLSRMRADQAKPLEPQAAPARRARVRS